MLDPPSGDLAVFGSEVRTFENYSTSDEDPGASRVTSWSSRRRARSSCMIRVVIDDEPPSGWRVSRAGRLPSLQDER